MDKLVSAMVQVTILVLLMVSTTLGATTCPPPEDAGPSMDEILYYSDVVVLGEVLEHYQDPQDPAAYTAEMEVYCVYKGHHVPSLINITKAGELLESETDMFTGWMRGCDDRVSVVSFSV